MRVDLPGAGGAEKGDGVARAEVRGQDVEADPRLGRDQVNRRVARHHRDLAQGLAGIGALVRPC